MENLASNQESSPADPNVNQMRMLPETNNSEKTLHFPIKLPKKQNCVYFKKQFLPGHLKHRTITNFGCACSNVPLCIVPCFRL